MTHTDLAERPRAFAKDISLADHIRSLRDAATAASPGTAGDLVRLDPASPLTRALEDLAIEAGVLHGFAERARRHARERTRPWPGTGVERGSEDPHLLRTFGVLISSLTALDELFEAAVASAATASADDVPAEIGLARNFAAYIGRTEISRVIEVLGASAASETLGFHRYWQFFADRRRTYRTLPAALASQN
ncbi:hypothetical protein K32_41600 [Kaistia sp. 32K]|uniref:hypothetical protein n=1 Tax=Kaistia sp. 32K TaxID=2795690 RepID=UPI001916955D|nr:hypothetical protein [Kaistia sp. 32K]BCP55543.1 hypothetical protein K32_41600 [Kaistia sp. 32K]